MIDIPVYSVDKDRRSDAMKYKKQYEEGEMTARQIANEIGVKPWIVQKFFYDNGVKKNKRSSHERVKSFAKFYKLRIYSAKQIALFTGYKPATLRGVFSILGFEMLSIANAVDEMVSDGVGFDRALHLIGKDIDQYQRSVNYHSKRDKHEHTKNN